jgi:hypothetical protein
MDQLRPIQTRSNQKEITMEKRDKVLMKPLPHPYVSDEIQQAELSSLEE